MAILGNIQDYEKKKAQQKAEASPVTPVPITSQSPSVMDGFKETGALNPQQPILQKLDVEKEPERLRNNYVQSFDTWEEAEKAGDISQQEFANAKIQEMVAKGQNPGEYMNVLSVLGSTESPAEKAKREKRERLGMVFNDLGNLIGNAANLYYTHRGGQYIDLNTANEQHRERMQRIKDKQDALDEERKKMLAKAKGNDVNAARAEKLANDKLKAERAEKDRDNAFKIKYDAYMKELDNAHKLGQIDAQTKAKLAEQAAKAKSDKELEAFRQQNRIALKTTPGMDESKILTSLTGSDGGTWTRNTNLSKEELRELSKYVEDWTPYTTVDENGKKTIDYIGAIADASDSGLIPDYILEEKGFKRSKDSSRRNKNEGFGYGKTNKEEGYDLNDI